MSLILLRPRQESGPGYFRLGSVVLDIPPEAIHTNKVIANEEYRPLRSKNALFTKTGHSRFDVTVSWKAVINRETSDFSSWKQLRKLVAMFKAAPFQEVENRHLRQVLLDQQVWDSEKSRMAFALRQLKIDTLPDIPDGLQVTLTLSLFNYLPYSKDFAYRLPGNEEKGSPLHPDATLDAFLDAWLAGNTAGDWEYQSGDACQLSWRKYQFVPLRFSQADSQPVEITPKWLPDPVSAGISGALSHQDDVRQKVMREAATRRVNVPLALAVAEQESGFRQFGADGTVVRSSAGALGVMQLMPDTAADLGVDPYDLEENIAGGVQYLGQLSSRYNGDLTKTLQAYNGGMGNVDLGTVSPEARAYAVTVRGRMGKFGLSNVVAPVAAQFPAAARVTPKYDPQAKDRELAAVVGSLNERGYLADYYTEKGIFIFQPESLNVNDFSDDRLPGGTQLFDQVPGPGLFTTSLSVLMVNNLPQIPLAAYEYPTYQHIGPPVVMVSVGLLSAAEDQGDEAEPEHRQLSRLSSAVSQLERQFFELRPEWRSVASIHRMQALFVQNNILNMLGIEALLPSNLTTNTVQDSPFLNQAELTGYQYENLYERLEPYRVKKPGDGAAVIRDAIVSPSSDIGAFLAGKPQYVQLSSLLQSRHAASRDAQLAPLLRVMKEPSFYESYSVSLPIPLDQERNNQIRGVILEELRDARKMESSSFGVSLATKATGGASSSAERFLEHASQQDQLDYGTYIRLKSEYPDRMRTVAESVDRDISQALAGGAEDPHDEFYQYAVAWWSERPGLQEEMQLLGADQEYQELLKTRAGGVNTPAQDNGRSAYQDLGIALGTGGPAPYLYDYAEQFRRDMVEDRQQIAEAAVKAHDLFNENRVVATTTPSGVIRLKAQDTVLNTVIPSRSMSRAFPTYKLFLMEEDSQGIFYCYDDFYSWASVLGFELIRYRDKPDLAVIQITNLANILGHRLYDNSVAGKREARQSLSGRVLESSDGSAMTRGAGTFVEQKVYAYEDVLGVNHQVSNLEKSMKTQDGQQVSVPLQYYALQPGSKIQLRMGFSENPDELYPVFHGKVTEIQGEEILTVVAQSFLVELVSPVAALDSSRGGLAFWTPGGSAVSVMGDAIEVETAKHFGKWQVDLNQKTQKNTSFASGWRWQALKSAAGVLGNERINSALSNLSSRARDNIQIGFNPSAGVPTDTVLVSSHSVEQKELEPGPAWQRNVLKKGEEVVVRVTSVLDGDTVQVKLSRPEATFTRIRLAYIDAPEKAMPGTGSMSSEALRKLVEGSNVVARVVGDSFGRGVAELLLGGRSINAELVQSGYTEVLSDFDPPEEYFRWEEEARQQKRGIWGQGYRKGDAALWRSLTNRAEDSDYDLYFHRVQEPANLLDARDSTYEKAWWGLARAAWYPPKQKDLASPWQIIRDVARRYPEQIVTVKNYGFPWTADATLVFNRPDGRYFARDPLTRELENQERAGARRAEFGFWWSGGGKKRYENLLGDVSGLQAQDIRTAEQFYAAVRTVKEEIDRKWYLLPGSKEEAAQIKLNAEQLRQDYHRYLDFVAANDTNQTGTLIPGPGDLQQAVRKFIMVSQENIIKNDIRVNDEIYNAVSFKDIMLKANAAIPDHYTRVAVIDRLVLNEDNLNEENLLFAVLQSYLKDEVARMYQGELVLTGMPEIEPYDVLMLYDPTTTMMGPVEVDSVIHSFDQEHGLITIVRPRAFVHINEFVSASLMTAVWNFTVNSTAPELQFYQGLLLGGAAGTAVGAGLLAGGVMVSPFGLFVVGGATFLGAALYAKIAVEEYLRNPLFITPLTRFEKPWIGGLQGFTITDFTGMLKTKYDEFMDYEIKPALDAYYHFRGVLRK